MSRLITDHIVDKDTAPQLTVSVMDEPGAGGASHFYHIDWISDQLHLNEYPNYIDIHFQNGPIKEVGINGITHEALLAIVIDRLRSFQDGPFPSAMNADAMNSCQRGLYCLQQRTRERISRGVEGKIIA